MLRISGVVVRLRLEGSPLQSPPWGAARRKKCPMDQNLVFLSCETTSNQEGPWSKTRMPEVAAEGNTSLGKSEFVAYQASARGGIVRVQMREDRVMLGGQAITVMKGSLL